MAGVLLEYLGLSLQHRGRHMQARAAVRAITDQQHPAVALGQEQGRPVERMLVSKMGLPAEATEFATNVQHAAMGAMAVT